MKVENPWLSIGKESGYCLRSDNAFGKVCLFLNLSETRLCIVFKNRRIQFAQRRIYFCQLFHNQQMTARRHHHSSKPIQ